VTTDDLPELRPTAIALLTCAAHDEEPDTFDSIVAEHDETELAHALLEVVDRMTERSSGCEPSPLASLAQLAVAMVERWAWLHDSTVDDVLAELGRDAAGPSCEDGGR
jgi:hypothetical protein